VITGGTGEGIRNRESYNARRKGGVKWKDSTDSCVLWILKFWEAAETKALEGRMKNT